MNNYQCRNVLGQFCKPTVGTLPDIHKIAFVSDSQDVRYVALDTGILVNEYDSFFVIEQGGDFIAVWGMHGVIPYTNKAVYRIV